MDQTETASYLLLDSHQGCNALDGWRMESSEALQKHLLTPLGVTPEGLRLAPLSSRSSVPLKDDQGSFGGLADPTGVATDSEGVIYVSDSKKNLIFKIVQREELQRWAHFFHIGKGPYANDRFVYVPTVNRLERWPRSLGRDPQKFSEIIVVCETVWNETQARQIVVKETKIPDSVDKEWEENYPPQLPAGDICKSSIECLPCLGGQGSAPRQLNEPRSLAISPSGHLYISDSKNHRVQVFELRGLVLKAIWGKRASTNELKEKESELTEDCLPSEENMIRFGQPIAGSNLGEFNEPWDLAVDSDGNVYVADKGNQRVQKFDCQTKTFSVIDGTELSAHFFQVLYGLNAGQRFVFIPARRRLEQWHKKSQPSNSSEISVVSTEVLSTSEARQLVLTTLNALGATDILVEWDTAYPKDLEADPQFVSPTHLAIDKQERLYVVDQDKDYVKILNRAGHVLGHATYKSEVSGDFKPSTVTIDKSGDLIVTGRTGIHRFHLDEKCCHHPCTAVEVDAKGDSLAVRGDQNDSTKIPSQELEKQGVYISQALDSNVDRCLWHKIVLDFEEEIPTGTSVTVWTYTSQEELAPDKILNLKEEDWQTGQTNANDFLILSGPGRYLWLKIEFAGDGVHTPKLQHLRVCFPRISYLQYLPSVYQADLVSKDFLDRFLSIFETTLSSIEEKIDNFSQYLDPDGTPQEFLLWLARWMDMIIDPSWPIDTQRRLLRSAAELYRQRGTVAGLKKFLELAFDAKIQILEHFQLRRWLFLTSQSTLGNRSQLWGNCIVQRLQLEENSRIGDFALVGTGDPVRDPFHVYAHKFSVFIPAAQCRSEKTERLMRYMIDLEKPAHTDYTLCKVEARFRVGMQSTLGFDTLVGTYPHMVLNQCSTLGYDTLLGRALEDKGSPTFKMGERSRVGINAVVG